MLTVRMLQAGAEEAGDAPGRAAIRWLQGDRQGAVQTLLQSLAMQEDAPADSACAAVLFEPVSCALRHWLLRISRPLPCA